MNESNDTDSAAALLSRIRPAAPSPEFMQRLLAARPLLPATTAKSKFVLFLPRLATVAAAVALAGMATYYFELGGSRQPAIATIFPVGPAAVQPEITAIQYLAPQESRQQLLGLRNLGLAHDAFSRPVRLMQATWLDDNVYAAGDGPPAMHESRVRDEIVPVLLTMY